MAKGFMRKIKPLNMLTEEQIEAIHKATLDVLEETGVRVEYKKALKLFEKNDCKVDYDEMQVRIPPSVAEECLRRCPSSFRWKARDPRDGVRLGGNTLHFMNFPGMQTVDLNTWEPRKATKKEYYDMIAVMDVLENLDLLSPYPYFGWAGLPDVMCIPESVAGKIRNSTKPQMAANLNEADIFIIEMAKVTGADIMGVVGSAPPLTFYSDQVKAAFRGAEAGCAMMPASGLVSGGTGPATIAGSTVSKNAETIAAIVLLQLTKPGTRVLVANMVMPQDMRSGSPAFGAIGISLAVATINQIYRHYRIPVNSLALTGSKSIDFQSGYERAIPAVIAALSGANILPLHGHVHDELTAHPVQAILDDDIAGMIGRFIEGVEVNEQTLATELIEEVGPIPGHFLNKEHTRKWWKKEQFVPKVADRLTYPEWMEKGKKSALDYAKERMEEMLATHKVSIPLTASQDEDIERILEEARKYYKKKGMMR